jgi:hypothetical protein
MKEQQFVVLHGLSIAGTQSQSTVQATSMKFSMKSGNQHAPFAWLNFGLTSRPHIPPLARLDERERLALMIAYLWRSD